MEELATKADLAAAVGKLEARMDAQRDMIMERIHDAQTELLRGFEVYAKASEARLKRLEMNDHAMSVSSSLFNERLALVENRLLEIEKKLLRP